MAFKGIKEFEANLKRLSSLTTQKLKTALELSANNVVDHAKDEHINFKSLSPETVAKHPHKRFYTRTSKLVNSMRIGKTTEFAGGIQVEVLAGYPGPVKYAPLVEAKYPYLEPALKATAKMNFDLIAKTVRNLLR